MKAPKWMKLGEPSMKGLSHYELTVTIDEDALVAECFGWWRWRLKLAKALIRLATRILRMGCRFHTGTEKEGRFMYGSEECFGSDPDNFEYLDLTKDAVGECWVSGQDCEGCDDCDER